MNEKPGISIVVPSFQQGPFIESTLRSLLAQRYTPLEILVIDGGSTDGTLEILQRYEKDIRWQSRPDQGQADAINQGFEKAHGEILGWLNSDDLLVPGALQQISALFQENSSIDVIYGHCVFVDRDGQFLRYFSEIRPFNAQVLTDRINFIAQPACFYRRRALQATGGLDTRLQYVMDWDLWCRMARHGLHFHFLPQILAAARMYPETKTSRGGWTRLREILTTNRKYGTKTLPRAFLYHFYSEHLKERRWVQTMNCWKKSFLRTTGGSPPLNLQDHSIILGCLPHSQDVSLPCRLFFPWYRPLREVILKVKADPSFTPARMLAVTINGIPVPSVSHNTREDQQEVTFRKILADGPFTEAIAIDMQAASSGPGRQSPIHLNHWMVR